MAGTSTKTQVISIRLPNDIVKIIERRIYVTGHYRTVSSYLRDRIIYDMTRKHGTYRRKR